MNNWQDITLGELYQGGKAALAKSREFLREHSPVWLNLEIEFNPQALQQLWELLNSTIALPFLYLQQSFAPPKSLPPAPGTLPALVPVRQGLVTSRTRHQPWYRRTTLLSQVLREAWAIGCRTYTQLMQQVQTVTGKGCSRRAIARFVKDIKSRSVEELCS